MNTRHRYIVVGDGGCGPALCLGHYDDTPRGGVLLQGDTVTVFSESSARRAIKRTLMYAKRNGYRWDLRHKLVRIEFR